MMTREQKNSWQREKYRNNPVHAEKVREYARTRRKQITAAFGTLAYCRRQLNSSKEKALQRGHIPMRITAEELVVLYADYNGSCPICQRDCARPVPDHDHGSGEVRQLICKFCNVMLGAAKDAETTLRRAADYVRSYRVD